MVKPRKKNWFYKIQILQHENSPFTNGNARIMITFLYMTEEYKHETCAKLKNRI